jgi:hypothetical protein
MLCQGYNPRGKLCGKLPQIQWDAALGSGVSRGRCRRDRKADSRMLDQLPRRVSGAQRACVIYVGAGPEARHCRSYWRRCCYRRSYDHRFGSCPSEATVFDTKRLHKVEVFGWKEVPSWVKFRITFLRRTMKLDSPFQCSAILAVIAGCEPSSALWADDSDRAGLGNR